MAMGWFRCVAEAIAHKGLRGILQEVPGGAWLYDVASDAYRRLHERRQDDHLRIADRQECEQVAQADQASIEAQMAVLAAEVERSLSGKLRHLPAADREALAIMIDAATNKLLHGPVTRLRALAADPRAEDYMEAVRALWDLPEPGAALSAVAPERTSVNGANGAERRSGAGRLDEAAQDALEAARRQVG